MPFRLKKPKRQFLLQLPTDHRTNLIPPSQLAALQLTPPSLPPPNPISNALVCSRLQSLIQHLSGKPKGQTCLLKPNSKDKSVVNIVWIYLLVSSHTHTHAALCLSKSRLLRLPCHRGGHQESVNHFWCSFYFLFANIQRKDTELRLFRCNKMFYCSTVRS